MRLELHLWLRPILLLGVFPSLRLLRRPRLLLELFSFLRLKQLSIARRRRRYRSTVRGSSAIFAEGRVGSQGFPAPGTNGLYRDCFTAQSGATLCAKLRPGQTPAAALGTNQPHRITSCMRATVSAEHRAFCYFLSTIRANHTILLSAYQQNTIRQFTTP